MNRSTWRARTDPWTRSNRWIESHYRTPASNHRFPHSWWMVCTCRTDLDSAAIIDFFSDTILDLIINYKKVWILSIIFKASKSKIIQLTIFTFKVLETLSYSTRLSCFCLQLMGGLTSTYNLIEGSQGSRTCMGQESLSFLGVLKWLLWTPV